MNAEELIAAGKPEEALAAVQQDIRKNPGDARLRIFLFQLLSILGSWEKALTQLNVLRDLNADCMLLAQIFRPAVECEALREAIFAGKRGPMIFGEPLEWIGLLVAANQRLAEGQFAAAHDLREQAFEAAPATTGSLNGRPFEWIADADSRLGPILEVIVDGKYYWVPFFRIRSIHIEPPHDLRDMVWTTAQFTWANGGQNPGLIPTRYVGTAALADSRLRLARLTEWENKSDETYIGFGQRILATDVEETPLLEVRTIEILSDPSARPD